MMRAAIAVTALLAADPFWARNETRTIIEVKRVVDWTRCDLSDVDASRLAGSRRTTPGRHLFPKADCRSLEWVGGAFAAGIDPPVGTFFKDPAAAEPAKPMGETVYPGDRLCREDRAVVAFLGDRVVLENKAGEGENCWRERHLGPRPFPGHWRRCTIGSSPEAPARPAATGKQAPRAVFADVDCGDVALQAVITSQSRFRGVETTERTAILVDRAGRLDSVRGGDRVCKSGLAVRDVGPARMLTEPDASGRNCFRP